MVLDVDATLVEIHTDKKPGTGPTYKGGWGFHPPICFADATGEALSGILRPGNAGANTVCDHEAVIDEAIAGLRQSRLAAGSAVVLASVMIGTLEDPNAPWRKESAVSS